MAERSVQFYHGTTHDVRPGDYIVPANQSGNSQWGNHGYGSQKSSEHAFATTKEDIGWSFAESAGRLGRSKAVLGYGPPVDRVRLHTVAPNPQMRPGVFNSAHPSHDPAQGDLHEWVAPKFRSTGTVDIMPGHQGTFPSLNWNQFSRPRMDPSQDANHPYDSEIIGGHGTNPIPPSGVTDRQWSEDIKARSEKNRAIESAKPRVDAKQLDLFSGKTVGFHADSDHSEVGDYHRNNLSGMTLSGTTEQLLKPNGNV